MPTDPVQEQEQLVGQLQKRVPPLADALAAVANAEEECRAANIDENDYTIFTLQDLEFEHELVVQSVSKKIAFIDNQVSDPFSCPTRRSRCFRADCLSQHDEPDAGAARAVREHVPVLRSGRDEHPGACGDDGCAREPGDHLLGTWSWFPHPQIYADVLQDEDMHLIHEELTTEYGAVTYEAFINLLVSSSDTRNRSPCLTDNARAG